MHQRLQRLVNLQFPFLFCHQESQNLLQQLLDLEIPNHGQPYTSPSNMPLMDTHLAMWDHISEALRLFQEVAFLFTDVHGATADLEAYLDPKPVVANSKGQISAAWKIGRYVSKKLIKPGVAAVRLTDTDYTLLAHDSIAFTE